MDLSESCGGLGIPRKYLGTSINSSGSSKAEIDERFSKTRGAAKLWSNYVNLDTKSMGHKAAMYPLDIESQDG